MKLIALEHCTKRYRSGDGEILALNDVSLQVDSGEFVAIIGSSGSGKSTLMNVLGCLDCPEEGSYHLDGESVFDLPPRALSSIRNRSIGFIFQKFHLIPSLNAKENVELQLRYRGVRAKERTRLAEQALARVGLANRMTHTPEQLSGGQQQRVAIARALAAAPPLILADEPTGNLDRQSADEVRELLLELNRAGHTVLLITHDEQVAATAGRVLTLRDGEFLKNEA